MTSDQEKAILRLIEILGGKEQTPENILEAGTVYLRETVYKEYPASNPKVVEALLLMYQIVCQQLFEKIDKGGSEDLVPTVLEEIARFGYALNKTIKTLAGN